MEEEDPFSYLAQPYSKQPLSQEDNLRLCPFVRESEEFMDSDSQSTWLSSSQPAGIIMESPPDSDPNSVHDDKFLTPPEHPLSSDNLKSSPPSAHFDENEVGGGSGCYLGGELCDCVIKDHVMEVVGCGFDEDGGLGEEIASKEVTEKVELGVGREFDENGDLRVEIVSKEDTEKVELGVGRDFDENGVLGGEIVSKETTEKVESGVGSVFDDNGDLGGGIVLKEVTDKVESGVGSCFDENGVLGGEIVSKEATEKVGSEFDDKGVLGEEIVSKEITEKVELGDGSEFDENGDLGGEIVSMEIAEKIDLGVGNDCDKSTQETENLDMVIHLNSEETVVVCGYDGTKVVDEMEVLSRGEVFGAGGDLGFGMEGSIDEEQCDSIVRDIVTKVGCEFDKNSVLDTEFMSEKITVCEEELELGGLGGDTGCNGNIENTGTDIILDSEEHAEEIKLSDENQVTHLDFDEKDPHKGEKVSNRKLMYGNVEDDRGFDVLSNAENKLVDGDGDGKGREYGNLSENCKDDVNRKRKLRGGERKLGGSDNINLGKSKEDIEKFKYVKPIDGVEREKDANQRARDESVSREGHVPLPNTEKGPMSEVGQESVKGNKRFMEFVNRAAELLKRENDSDTEVDLMETLKKKGVKFPRPSWWPPERI